ncbi:MAG: trypsin-like peptidase domain-containing protein [Candidatus Woesebacteria bacterium]|nr:trypsin-like peptidase domain-containing protein [Candidatus Woesebacteria bacterium]
MKHRLFSALAVLLLVCGSIGLVFGEDKKPAEVAAPPGVAAVSELTAQEVADLYKDTVVQIDVALTREDGSEDTWLGSGCFIDDKGTILTAGHVAWDDDTSTRVSPPKEYKYWVTLHGRKYEAKLVSVDRYKDVALIRIADIDKASYRPAKLGDSEKMKQGDSVYALGSPLGLTGSFSAGKVGAVHRYLETGSEALWSVQDFIQTDAPINPGNSGGPLVNSHGEVIGVNVAGVRGADGLGFAVAINFANIPKLLATSGVVQASYLGSEVMLDNFARTGAPGEPGYQDISMFNKLTGIDNVGSLQLLSNLTYPATDQSENHAVVLTVDAKSPAELAGLKRGDIVTSLDGKVVKSGRNVRLQLLDIPPGKEVELKVMRIEKGAVHEVVMKVTLLKEKPKN